LREEFWLLQRIAECFAGGLWRSSVSNSKASGEGDKSSSFGEVEGIFVSRFSSVRNRAFYLWCGNVRRIAGERQKG
jgi:hypothetical protein